MKDRENTEEQKMQRKRMEDMTQKEVREIKCALTLIAGVILYIALLVKFTFLLILISLFVLLTFPVWKAMIKSDKFNKK